MTVAYPRAVSRFAAAAVETQNPTQASDPMARWRDPPRRRAVVRLWLPVTPLFWLLAPIPLLLAPLAWLAPPAVRPRNPFAAVLAIGRLLTALRGTVVRVDTRDALVRIRVL